jgi:hypothetical protein
MRRRLAVLILPALLAVVLLAPPAPGLTRPQTFSLLSVEAGGAEIDNFDFRREPRAGDRFTFTDVLYKWAGSNRGARVGRVEGLCTFTKVAFRANDVGAHCVASFFLPGGQIYVGGFIRFTEGPGNFHVPVLGGDGSYANARGYVRIRDLGGEDSGKSNNEFHLLP